MNTYASHAFIHTYISCFICKHIRHVLNIHTYVYVNIYYVYISCLSITYHLSIYYLSSISVYIYLLKGRLSIKMSNTLSLPFRQEPSFLPLRDSDSDIIRCDECSAGVSSESHGSKERRKLSRGGIM